MEYLKTNFDLRNPNFMGKSQLFVENVLITTWLKLKIQSNVTRIKITWVYMSKKLTQMKTIKRCTIYGS